MELGGDIYVVAESSQLAALDNGPGGAQAALAITRVPLPIDKAIPDEVVSLASVVVIQADPASKPSMQRIADLRAARPFMPLIVALQDTDLGLVRSLIRQGVNDVVTLPFDSDQLNGALLDAAVGAEHRTNTEVTPAPLYAVLGSVGGVGATTVATHLAAALAREKGNCCLLDLDVQFGTAASFLGVNHKSSVNDLLGARDRLDPELLRSVSVDRGNGLHVVSAPQSILPLEDVDAGQLLRILDLARRNSKSVVIDLPANFTSWSLSALMQASVVLMAVELSIASLRQAKRQLDLLTDIGLDRSKVKVIVNRVERRLFRTIGLGDVETALGVPALASISAEPGLLTSAQDQGLLAEEVQKKNRLSADFARLPELLDLCRGDE